MLWKCCTQYVSKYGKLSSGHRTAKGQFSFQSQRRARSKNVQTTAQLHSFHMLDFPGGSDSKSIYLQCGKPRFDPWVGKIPWRRKWQPTPVFLPGDSQGQRSLVGCRLWGRTELDTTEWLTLHLIILWHCLSLGLEWKLTFCSPVATAEFSKFAGILSAALS